MKINACLRNYRSWVFHMCCCAGLISLLITSQIDTVQAKVNESIPQETIYTVQTGDTLWQISQAYGLEVEELKAANQLTADIIKVGQELTIPQSSLTDQDSSTALASDEDNYIVQSGDSLWKIAKLLKINIKELQKLNHLQSDLLQVGQVLLLPKDKSLKKEIEFTEDAVEENKGFIPKQKSNKKEPNLNLSSYKYSFPNWWGSLNKEAIKIPSLFTARLGGFLFEENSRMTLEDIGSFKSSAIKVSSLPSAVNGKQTNRIEEPKKGSGAFFSSNLLGKLKQAGVFYGVQELDVFEPIKEINDQVAAQQEKQTQVKEKEIEENGTELSPAQTKVSEEDLEWLAKIIEAEAEGEPYLGKVAVGSVVMNRVEDDWFPDTIKEVIFQKVNKVYQFSPVGNGRIDRITPSEDAYKAAKEALNGEDPTNGALYFYNASISKDKWIRTRTISTEIGQHKFAF